MADASVTAIDGRGVVRVGGSELFDAYVGQAIVAADGAAASQAAAELAAASALAASRYYATRAAGEAASTVNQLFSTDDSAGSVIYYRKNASGSTEIGRAVTPASLAAANGASKLGYVQGGVGSLARTQDDVNRERVSILDFIPAASHAAIKAGTDTTDWSAAFDKAVAEVVAGTLYIPAGLYHGTLTIGKGRINVKGAGVGLDDVNYVPTGGTVLRAADAGKPAIQIGINATWERMTIEGIRFAGKNLDFTTNAIAFGQPTHGGTDHFAGHVVIRDCLFQWLDKAILRRYGNLDVQVLNSSFRAANYHVHSTGYDGGGGDIMHAGCFGARDCHFEVAQKACHYIDSSTTGTGLYVSQNNIYESSPGFVWFVKNFNSTGAVPSLSIGPDWNEANNTAGSTVIDGASYQTQWGRFANATAVVIHDTPVGPLEIFNSQIRTQDCALDLLTRFLVDASSTLNHDNARSFGGNTPLGIVRSVGAIEQPSGPSAPTYTMPGRSVLSKQASALIANACGSVVTVTGSATRATVNAADGILPGMTVAQDLTINPGESLFPTPVAVPAGWLVWVFAHKLISGPALTFQISGGSGLSSIRTVNSADWQTFVGSVGTPAGASSISLWITGGTAQSILRLGGFALLSFSTRQKAQDFINAGIFPL
jgi:hypothetical protein